MVGVSSPELDGRDASNDDEPVIDPAYQEGETEVAIKFKLKPIPLEAGDCVRWSWQVQQGFLSSMDIGFRVIFISHAGERNLPFEGRLLEHGGEYIAQIAGHLRLIWDNSHSWFSDKTLTYICHKMPRE